MAVTGVERKVDKLGRVVIPKEFCKSLAVTEGTPLFIYMEGGKIVMEKSQGICAICSSTETVMTEVGGRKICRRCINEIKLLP